MLDAFKKNLLLSALVSASLILSYFLWTRGGNSFSENFYQAPNIFQHEEAVVHVTELTEQTTSLPRSHPVIPLQASESLPLSHPVTSPHSSESHSGNPLSLTGIKRDGHDEVEEAFNQLQGESHLWFEGGAPSKNNEIKTLGKLHNTSSPLEKYAVFSTTTSNREALGFAFYLPLTVIAWHRVGFRSIVVVIGTIEQWYADDVLHHILESILELQAFVIFLEAREERSVMMSQVSRLFVANILNVLHPSLPEYYLVTSDTDLWPIAKDSFVLPANKSILSLNSDCCGQFTHHHITYKMLPIANIGMKASTWRNVTSRFSFSPASAEEIITFLLREFGGVAIQEVVKGENLGWFLDQRSISMLIAEWTKPNSTAVEYVPRNVEADRIDRATWNPQTLDGISDAHLLENAFVPGTWVRVRDLLLLMFGEDGDQVQWCDSYYEKFSRLYINQFHRPR